MVEALRRDGLRLLCSLAAFAPPPPPTWRRPSSPWCLEGALRLDDAENVRALRRRERHVGLELQVLVVRVVEQLGDRVRDLVEPLCPVLSRTNCC